MTVPSETSRSLFTGNGATTVFSPAFYFRLADELVVTLTPSGGTPVIQTEGVHYTVALCSAPGQADGEVTMLAAPAAAAELKIERTVPFTQETSLRQAGEFDPVAHEDQFDELTFQTQQLDRRVSDIEDGSLTGDFVAGNGLSMAATTLNVGAGDGIVVSADAVAVDFATANPAGVVSDAGFADDGVATKPSRSDHAHVALTGAPAALAVGAAQDAGASISLARADHGHEVPLGSPVDLDASAASDGASGLFADAEHKHQVVTGSPVEITDSTEADGVSDDLARSDHQHGHGDRGGGSLHPLAVAAGAAGFLSGTEKTMLVKLADLAHVKAFSNLAQTWAAGAGAAVAQFDSDGAGVVGPTLWDNGSDFDPATFKFTAPRTGFYQVNCNMRFSKSGGGNWTVGDQFAFTLYKNGATFLWEGVEALAQAAIAATISSAWSTTVYLAAGDTLEVRGAATGVSTWAVTKGYLSVDELG